MYMNAWKSDFLEDPLVAIVAELSSAISQLGISGRPIRTIQKALDRTRAAASAIARRALPGLVRIATAGVLDGNELADGLAAIAGDVVEDRLKAYEDGKTEIEEFRSALVHLSIEIASIGNEADKKVIILIDELDRCRPLYAIELLERVKHLFDTAGVIFVLGVDRSQLAHSIEALYGSTFDASGYLRRFIDIDYRLPAPEPGVFCSHLFCIYNIAGIILSRESRERQSELRVLEQVLSDLFSAAGFSLRQQEQTIARLRVVLQTIPANHYLFELSLSMLIFLREWEPSTYLGLVEGRVDIERLLARLEELPGMRKVFSEHRGHLIEATLLAGAAELEIPAASRLEQYREVRGDENKDLEIRRRADRVLTVMEKLSVFNGGSGFKETFKRVELVKPFLIYSERSDVE